MLRIQGLVSRDLLELEKSIQESRAVADKSSRPSPDTRLFEWDALSVINWYKGPPSYVSKLELRSSRRPLYRHEFLIIYTQDTSYVYLTERQPDSSPPQIICEYGCRAYDSIRKIEIKELKRVAGESDCLMRLEWCDRTLDMEFILSIIVAINEVEETKRYTIQQYNCYFFARTIIMLALRYTASWEKRWGPGISEMPQPPHETQGEDVWSELRRLLPTVEQFLPTDLGHLGWGDTQNERFQEELKQSVKHVINEEELLHRCLKDASGRRAEIAWLYGCAERLRERRRTWEKLVRGKDERDQKEELLYLEVEQRAKGAREVGRQAQVVEERTRKAVDQMERRVREAERQANATQPQVISMDDESFWGPDVLWMTTEQLSAREDALGDFEQTRKEAREDLKRAREDLKKAQKDLHEAKRSNRDARKSQQKAETGLQQARKTLQKHKEEASLQREKWQVEQNAEDAREAKLMVVGVLLWVQANDVIQTAIETAGEPSRTPAQTGRLVSELRREINEELEMDLPLLFLPLTPLWRAVKFLPYTVLQITHEMSETAEMTEARRSVRHAALDSFQCELDMTRKQPYSALETQAFKEDAELVSHLFRPSELRSWLIQKNQKTPEGGCLEHIFEGAVAHLAGRMDLPKRVCSELCCLPVRIMFPSESGEADPSTAAYEELEQDMVTFFAKHVQMIVACRLIRYGEDEACLSDDIFNGMKEVWSIAMHNPVRKWRIV